MGVNTKITPPLRKTAIIAAAIAIAISAFIHFASSLAPVLANSIRQSSVYDGNNIAGDVLLTTAIMFISVVAAVSIAALLRSRCIALRGQRDALRAENDALRSQCIALRAQCDALRAQNDAILRDLDKERAHHGRAKREYRDYRDNMDEVLQRKSDTIVSLENKIIEWSNRYYALRSRLLSK